MTEQNKILMSKKSVFIKNAKIALYILILIIFIFMGILVFIIVNKDNITSRWIVDNSFLKDYIKLSDSNNEKNNTLTANTFFALNNENNSYRFSTSDKSLTTVELVEKQIPSVVSISVKTNSESGFNQEQVAGTGYFVDKSGLIVTNKHVISPACSTNNQAKIIGVTHDQKNYELKLMSIDPIEDLAILKIIAPDKDFSQVKFADSNNLKLGTEVIAIGNALGELQNTVTKGIISGLNRNITQQIQDPCTGLLVYPDSLIQTDAAINQGNSGGPLFDNTGLLIGMNTYGTGGENIGLAIPSSRIIAALNSFQKNGKIIRPKLGISTKSISPLLKSNNPWLPVDYGELIYARGLNPIVQDSAADKAGLREGDIILEVNRVKLERNSTTSTPLKTLLLSFDVDSEIELTVLKATRSSNGWVYTSPISVKVVLGGQSLDLTTPVLK